MPQQPTAGNNHTAAKPATRGRRFGEAEDTAMWRGEAWFTRPRTPPEGVGGEGEKARRRRRESEAGN
ncbi:hypothetical protein E2C01_051780 [Portunus trituberculatus]|uniref:Uncharacterized protein n=1 Tax=Portunus trituberculatus TaxID=210409 RepID=A0A5B7GFT3_PORTR|nr:hypothetical protein [Portunus trituberculatus]